ncbi:MAG: polysaccharide deacetylase family protein [Candidatus Omnitrophota bacterium]
MTSDTHSRTHAFSHFLPILTYHGLVQDGVRPDGHYTLSVSQLESHLEHLARRHFRVVSLEEVIKWLSGEMLPEKSVSLTFDDGLESDYSLTLPILKRHGFSATFFVNPAQLGKEGYLTAETLRELNREGMAIGSHGSGHVFLTRLSTSELEKEVAGSKAELESLLQREVSFFSVPRGRYNRRTLEAIRQSGYRAACTSDIGMNSRRTDPFCLRRWAMKGHYSISDFISVVEGHPRGRLVFEHSFKQAAYRLLGHTFYEVLRDKFVVRRTECRLLNDCYKPKG